MTFPEYPERPLDQGPGQIRRPTTLVAAFWLGIASAVVGFGSLAASFYMIGDTQLQAIMRAAENQGRQITMDQARSLFQASAIAVLIVFLVIAGLWVMFLFFMRNGRNWARIVIAIVAAVWIFITAPSLSSGALAGALFGVLQLLTIVATVVFAFVRPSQGYFDAVRNAKNST